MYDYSNDRYAKACLAEAQKGKSDVRFGAVLVKGNSILGRGHNRRADATLRSKLNYVDYCIHGEQDSILDATEKGYNVAGARCYVFGYIATGKHKGTLTVREAPVFGCKRCPHTFEQFNVSVCIPHVTGWIKLSPTQARDTAQGIQGIWTNFVRNGVVENRNYYERD